MNKVGTDLVAGFEGYSDTPYLCPAGVWTIGFGTTRYPGGKRVAREDNPCTKAQAEEWLNHELERSEHYVINSCPVYLNENQRAALASFVYNLGRGAFRASTLRKRISAGRFDDVPHQLSRWNKAGGRILNGLIRRRAAEAELWLLQPEYVW
jgi:lysozyme